MFQFCGFESFQFLTFNEQEVNSKAVLVQDAKKTLRDIEYLTCNSSTNILFVSLVALPLAVLLYFSKIYFNKGKC